MWRAIAMTCGGQLVETPAAAAAKIAFSNAFLVRMSREVMPASMRATTACPLRIA